MSPLGIEKGGPDIGDFPSPDSDAAVNRRLSKVFYAASRSAYGVETFATRTDLAMPKSFKILI